MSKGWEWFLCLKIRLVGPLTALRLTRFAANAVLRAQKIRCRWQQRPANFCRDFR
jgi:hypothetical protein